MQMRIRVQFIVQLSQKGVHQLHFTGTPKVCKNVSLGAIPSTDLLPVAPRWCGRWLHPWLAPTLAHRAFAHAPPE
jgi:hypothetical protein